MPAYAMTIYNRWGQPVFQADGRQPWRGEVQASGRPAPEGVYVYLITFEGTMKKKIFEGRVTLVR
jgi:hypothetical protein